MSMLGCAFVSAVQLANSDPVFKEIFDENAPVMDPMEMLTKLMAMVEKIDASGNVQDLDEDEMDRQAIIRMFVDLADPEGLNCDLSEIDEIIEGTDEQRWPNLASYLDYFKQKRADHCVNVD